MHRVLVKRADPHSANYPGVITSHRNPTPLHEHTHTHTLQHLRVTAAVYLGLISHSAYVILLISLQCLGRRGPQTCRSRFELQINDRCRTSPRQGHSDYQRL